MRCPTGLSPAVREPFVVLRSQLCIIRIMDPVGAVRYEGRSTADTGEAVPDATGDPESVVVIRSSEFDDVDCSLAR